MTLKTVKNYNLPNLNNLFRWAMSGYLPYVGFEWLQHGDRFDVNSFSVKSSIEYISEADLKYPDELHVLHNDYPLAPKKLPYEILSDYCKKIADEYGIKVVYVRKIIANLGNKTNYVLRYRNLQVYLSLGMKLTKIHRVLKYKQSDWMKKYIDFNTENRTNAVNVFEKDFIKLMTNSAYGKTMERINVRLVNNEKDFLKQTSRSTHFTHRIFDKNYAAIHEIKPVLALNKPTYVGFTVLELCKWLMYDFHYSFIKNHFDAELLFSDTDSLTY